MKVDFKQFYLYGNSKRLTRDKIGLLKDINGKIRDSSEEMGDILNDYFSTIITHENSFQMLTATIKALAGRNISISDVIITRDKVLKSIDKLQILKAVGVDNIVSTLMKECQAAIAVPLTRIMQEFLRTGSISCD